MKITVKEIGISGAIIIGSGLLIRAVSALYQRKPTSSKLISEESNPKRSSKPVVQMEVAFKSEPVKKPTQNIDQTKVATKEVILPEQTVSEIVSPEVEEIETEVVKVNPSDTLGKITPKLARTNDDFPLQLGSKGARVFELQKYLLKRHGWGGEVTDIYDQNLADRVQKLLKVEQVDKGLFNKLIHKRKRRR